MKEDDSRKQGRRSLSQLRKDSEESFARWTTSF